MDGNGRWASQRGLPRSEGHRAGIQRSCYTTEVNGDRVLNLAFNYGGRAELVQAVRKVIEK